MTQTADKIARAFHARKPLTLKNTTTDGYEVRHHGNLIAWRDPSNPHVVYMTLAGWPIVTTRDRLNALGMGRFCQIRGEQYYDPWLPGQSPRRISDSERLSRVKGKLAQLAFALDAQPNT